MDGGVLEETGGREGKRRDRKMERGHRRVEQIDKGIGVEREEGEKRDKAGE